MRVGAALLLFIVVAGGLMMLSQADSGAPMPILRLDTPRPYVPDSGLDDAERRALENLSEAEQRLAEIRAEEARRVVQATAAAWTIYTEHTEIAAQETARVEATAAGQIWIINGWTATHDANISTATAEYQETRMAREEQDAEFLRREQQRLEERHDLTNKLLAILPYAAYILAIAAALAVTLLALYKYALMPWIVWQDKKRGTLPVVYTNGGHLVNLSRVPVGVTAHKGHQISAPEMAAADAQERATARAQLSEAMNNGLPGATVEKPRKSPEMLQAAAPPEAKALPAGPRVEIILAGQTPPELLTRPDVMPVLEGEWRKA